MEHLQELRMRLATSAGTIAFMMIPAWFLYNWPAGGIFGLLYDPLQHFGPLHYFGPLDGFTLQLKIAAATAVVLSLPMLLYQMWAFIAPGLTKKERKNSVPFVSLGLVLFLAGAYTGWRILPLAVNFLLSFTTPDLQSVIEANQWIGFVGIIMLIFGVSFEMPLVLLFLCQIGVISSAWLIRKLRYSVFIIFVASLLITPGADPISPLVLGTIMTGLYGLAIVLAKIIGK
jgi:sec-independent protein translocase protein TatC